MSVQNVDVLVIGAGPAGTIAACIINKAGFKTKIVEKEKFMRKEGHCAKINTDREETNTCKENEVKEETLRRSPAGRNPARKERGATQPEASHA